MIRYFVYRYGDKGLEYWTGMRWDSEDGEYYYDRPTAETVASSVGGLVQEVKLFI